MLRRTVRSCDVRCRIALTMKNIVVGLAVAVAIVVVVAIWGGQILHYLTNLL